MMHFIKIFPILFVIAMIGLIVSCEDDKTTNPQDQAPTIPPQSSMIIDFNEFPDTSSLSKIDFSHATKGNWSWAARNVAAWNSVLTLTLAIPVSAFKEAFNHQAVKQTDGSWLWQYSISINEALFTAKLFGKTVTEGVEWKMLLTKTREYTNFEWFTGFSNLPTTEGTWTLNKDPNTPSGFLAIEWKRNTQDGTADVKYILLSPSLPQDAAGPFDVLSPATAALLALALFRSLKPGGTLVVANLARGIREVGYAEAFMDWHTVYRDPREMFAVASRIPEAWIADRRSFAAEGGRVSFLVVRRT